jgi:hypothetical protein
VSHRDYRAKPLLSAMAGDIGRFGVCC